jgi:hypothetical protein
MPVEEIPVMHANWITSVADMAEVPAGGLAFLYRCQSLPATGQHTLRSRKLRGTP